MSDREYEYFTRKDKECSDFNTTNIAKSNSIIAHKVNTISIGGFSNRLANVIQYTRDFKISKNIEIYTSLGLPNFGLGLSWQNNYNKNGWNANIGLDFSYYAFAYVEALNYYNITYSICYQWKLGKSSNFFSFGILHNDNYWSDITRPIVSFDRRF